MIQIKYKIKKQRLNFFYHELRLYCLKYALYNNFFYPLFSTQFKRDLVFLLQYNSSKYFLKDNVLNYCILTGNKRSVYRKFQLSRHCVKKLGSFGLLYGLTKSSW